MIRGEKGEVFIKQGDDGEFVKIGNVRELQYDSLYEHPNEQWRPTPEAFVTFHLQLERLVKALKNLGRGIIVFDGEDQGHGGGRLRRRKHGGRWPKLDRRQKKPPAWLVRKKRC